MKENIMLMLSGNFSELIISHIRECDGKIQSNEDHSRGVAELAELFAKEFGMGDWGRMLGELHDKGKERDSFQKYIRKATGIDPDADWYGEDKQHSFVGAVMAKEMYKQASSLLGYPIMGHHGGLDDYTDYEEKLNKPVPSEVTRIKNVLPLDSPKELLSKIRNEEMLKRDMHHIVRMLFSCLVDADFLDTEAFMDEEHSRLRQKKATLTELAPALDAYLQKLSEKADSSPLNKLRQQIQIRCREMSECEPGVFSLTVPTGGGKTLSSLVWAVNHALKHSKKRIIIAIPYTSIVTQTAQILGRIFGPENVLEHHSNFNEQQIKDSALRRKMKLATENWDYPIIVTTNVQLLESMMSNKPSSCRKLHNIANSVLIMDEVQTFPIEHLQPIIDTLQTYQRLFGVSILFTTASLPALRGDICWGRGTGCKLRGFEKIQEIIPEDWLLYERLRRTRLNIDLTPISSEELASQLTRNERVLCVVNTRKEAKSIYELLPDGGINIHLSRMMCSAHLKKSIGEMKEMLADDSQAIRVIATQLIEAGVDVDFPVVYRQEAGLDSVLQAAGRCNREGRRDVCDVFVFRLDKKPFGSIGRASDAWRDMDADWFAPKTMQDYFIQRYSRQDTFDKAELSTLLYRPNEWMFETASQAFRMIDDNGNYSVVVNYEDSPILVEQLRKEGPSYSLMKRISQYSVNIHRKDFEILAAAGLVEEVIDGFYYVPDRAQYREDVGLVMDNRWMEEILVI